MGGAWLCKSRDDGIAWHRRVAYRQHMGGIWEADGRNWDPMG